MMLETRNRFVDYFSSSNSIYTLETVVIGLVVFSFVLEVVKEVFLGAVSGNAARSWASSLNNFAASIGITISAGKLLPTLSRRTM